MLYFNYELKIETGNENTKQNAPLIHNLAEHFKTKYYVFFPKKRGKDLCHYTRGVQCKSTKVSVVLLNTRGVHLCIIYSSIRDTLCMRHNSY